MTSPPEPGPVLALDGGSSRLSVAVGDRREVRAERSAPADRSSSTLLRLVDDCLGAAGLVVGDLVGILALRGPGSFTGLRVTLALAQALHQASGRPAGTLSTLETLAAQVDSAATALAVVRAGRGVWNAQLFTPGSPPDSHRRSAAEPIRLTDAELPDYGRDASGAPTLVGFDLYASLPDLEPSRIAPSAPLASVALGLLTRADWDPSTLGEPLYLAPPPATEPSPSPSRPASPLPRSGG